MITITLKSGVVIPLTWADAYYGDLGGFFTFFHHTDPEMSRSLLVAADEIRLIHAQREDETLESERAVAPDERAEPVLDEMQRAFLNVLMDYQDAFAPGNFLLWSAVFDALVDDGVPKDVVHRWVEGE